MSTRSGRRAYPHSAVLWVAVVALAAAAVPSHAWWMETQLAGIRLGDNAMILLDIPGYGQPDGIIVATATSADRANVPGAEGGQGPGLTGPGGTGAAGPGAAGMMGPGAAGMMGPGGGPMGSGPGMMGGGMGPGMARGSTRSIPSAVAPVTPVQMAMGMAAPMGSMGSGGGMGMPPGQIAAGATGPMAGAGGMMGGQPGMMGGAGPGPGMTGMPGMAGPGGAAGAAGAGAGGFVPAQGVSDFPDWVMAIWFDLHEDEIEWFYMRDKCAVGFVINKNSGKIVAISVAGERCDFARTAMGRPHETVKLGDDFKRVLQRYMWPHTLETFTGSGSSVLTNFGEGTSVTFGSVTFGGATNVFRRDAILWYHEVRGLKQGNVAFTLHDMKVTRIHIWDPDPS